MSPSSRLVLIGVATAMLAGAASMAFVQDSSPARPRAAAQDQQPRGGETAQDQPADVGGFPDLIGALKASPGCMGVDAGQTMSGKNVIFAFFKDKQAVLDWYYSETHQQVRSAYFPGSVAGQYKPLSEVPDDAGPLMVIASVTMSDKPQHDETSLPVSQISIEVYAPVTDGLAIGGAFAPDGFHELWKAEQAGGVE